MSPINFEIKPRKDITIVLLDRDSKGNPTGRKVEYSDDEGLKVHEFFEKHTAMMDAKQRRHKQSLKKQQNKNSKKR